MKAVALFGVFVLARVLVLADRDVPLSIWTPAAYLWQDAAAALAFHCLDRLCGRRRALWALYAILVVYVALNVPIARMLSSPLTPNMIRAARGPLLDSVLHHLTAVNVGLLLMMLTAGATLPRLLARPGWRQRGEMGLAVAAAVIVAAGPAAMARVDTRGLHRNALGALWAPALPAASGNTAMPALRDSPFRADSAEDLTWLRGAAAGRNVVLVVLESTAALYLQPYGAFEDPMPRLSEWAARSLLFENAYAVYPESVKGLLATLCARYPSLQTTAESYGGAPRPSLASVLAAAGYRTALFHSGRFMYLGMRELIDGWDFQQLEDAGDIGGNHESSFGVDEPAAVSRILSWIDGLPGDSSFFVTYLPVAGHHPYASPAAGPFSGDDDLTRYRNALHYGDAALGRLLDGLRRRRLQENTLFVFLSDHGQAFGQHEGNYGHTLFLYEENIRVPFLIAAPGLIDEALRVRRTASLIDTGPTVLDLLGLPAPEEFQGASLLSPQPRMAFFFTDYSLNLLGLRDGCWKYVYEMDSGRSRLFDLCGDAGERRSRSAAEEVRVELYRQRVLGWAGGR